MFVLERLTDKELSSILKRALHDADTGLGALALQIEDEAICFLASCADGDARVALNLLELTTEGASRNDAGVLLVDTATVQAVLQRSHPPYDKSGEQHYNLISALHKSMRSSDADAAIYWMARMLQGGEDPKYVSSSVCQASSART